MKAVADTQMHTLGQPKGGTALSQSRLTLTWGAAIAAMGLGLAADGALAMNREQKQALKVATDAWNAFPSEGLPAALTSTLSIEATLPPYAGPDEIVFEMPDSAPTYATVGTDQRQLFAWVERATLAPGPHNTVEIAGRLCFRDYLVDFQMSGEQKTAFQTTQIRKDSGCYTRKLLTDRAGFLVLRELGGHTSWGPRSDHHSPNERRMVELSLSGAPIPTPGGWSLPFSKYEYSWIQDDYQSNYERPYVNWRIGATCEVVPKGQKAVSNCATLSGFEYSPVYAIDFRPLPAGVPTSEENVWSDLLGMYLIPWGEFCLQDRCGTQPHRVLDWRKGSQWHSKSVSAALSPEQRQKANALFAAGFDSYKGGDFTSAGALMKRGMEIDPANHLAWFTLGEIARARYLKAPDDVWLVHLALHHFRRTVELGDADAPEVIKSQARLSAQSID